MHIRFLCPACEQTVAVNTIGSARAITCPNCGWMQGVPDDAVDENDQLTRCLVCPSTDLFQRKDFPQRLGVALFFAGVVGSSIAWAYGQLILTFAILFASLLIDFLLYLVVGDVLTCYRCHAEYRGSDVADGHSHFDHETHERHRQLAARSREAAQRHGS